MNFASDGTPTFTAEDEEKKDWIHAFIAGASARVHARFHTEPGMEPERVRWHWNRNLMLMDECGKVHGAYRERFGMEMPENWARTALALEFAHHTNPYPMSTVQDMAFR